MTKKLPGGNKDDALYLWSYRAVATQTNAAGGAIVIQFTPGAGNYVQLIQANAINSGTNTAICQVRDSAGNNLGTLANIASAATTGFSLPSIGAVATTSGNTANSQGIRIYGTDQLRIYQSGAGVQNDTLIVSWRMYIRSSTAPTVSKANSTNAADVTLVETYNTVAVA